MLRKGPGTDCFHCLLHNQQIVGTHAKPSHKSRSALQAIRKDASHKLQNVMWLWQGVMFAPPFVISKRWTFLLPKTWALPKSDTGRNRQQGVLRQVASNAKRSRFLSGVHVPSSSFQMAQCLWLSINRELACKETDSALNFGHQSKGTNAISLTKQETGKDTDKRQKGREREREKEREQSNRKRTWYERTRKKRQSL